MKLKNIIKTLEENSGQECSQFIREALNVSIFYFVVISCTLYFVCVPVDNLVIFAFMWSFASLFLVLMKTKFKQDKFSKPVKTNKILFNQFFLLLFIFK